MRITQLNQPAEWPWSYGILSWRSASGLELGSTKAYSTQLGEVFRLGVGLPPSDRTGSIWFEPRGFNLGWLKAGFPWELSFEAQAGSGEVNFNPYWGRVNSTLSPANAGDSVDVGSGIELNADGSATFGNGKAKFYPSGSLFVGNTAADSTQNISGTGLTAEGTIYSFHASTSIRNVLEAYNFNVSTANPVIKLARNGDATFIGNITAANVSDVRFKTNIQPASPQLADVVALGNQLKNWNWNDDAPLNNELRARRFLGLVAQEAEKVCPELTYTVGEGDDSYKAINHDILVMKLLGAVAELQAEVAVLNATLRKQ